MTVEARLTPTPASTVQDRIAAMVEVLAQNDDFARAAEARGAVPEEAERREADAPWTPVPTRAAEDFLRDVPEAILTLMFPTVYEEDRSVMLKDLATVQALGAITHERMSAQMVKELGIDEDYDYHEEQAAISAEQSALPQTDLGVGDVLARRVIGLGPKGGVIKPDTGASPSPELSTPVSPTSGRATFAPSDGNGSQPKRDDLSGDATRQFRQQQREAIESLTAEVRRLREAAAEAEPATHEREVRLEALLAQQDRLTEALLKTLTAQASATPPVAPIVIAGPEDAEASREMRTAIEALQDEVRVLRALAEARPAPPPPPIEVHLPAQATVPSIVEVIQPAAVAMRHSVERDHRHPDDPQYDPRAPITRIIDEPIDPPPAPAPSAPSV
jgi:hypothetical protein